MSERYHQPGSATFSVTATGVSYDSVVRRGGSQFLSIRGCAEGGKKGGKEYVGDAVSHERTGSRALD